MRRSALVRSLLLMLTCLAAGLAFANPARADLEVSETGLSDLGAAAEINPDAQGRLWISDYGAGEVWGFDPVGNSVEVYPVGGSPSDARHDGTNLWWADGASNSVGRASTKFARITRWEMPGANSLYGTALDDSGRLWVTSANSSHLYRLKPATPKDELCTYTLPDGGKCTYIVSSAGYLWLGDWVNGRLLRLRVSDNSLASWSLPAGSRPFGMALDGEGKLWYADQGLQVLARFNPNDGRLDSYALPEGGGTAPAMIAVVDGKVWYTEQGLASIGVLDPPPAVAYSGQSLTPASLTLAPVCIDTNPAPDTSVGIVRKTGLSWSQGLYSTILYQDGWQVYQMPDSSAPWGITSTPAVWYVDTDRGVLGKITAATPCVMPAAVTDLGIAKASATEVTLSWSPANNADQYYLWRGNTPYFTPGTDCVGSPNCVVVTTGTSDTQVALGNVAESNIWVVQPAATCGKVQATPSNRVAEFEFALVKGSN